MSKFCEAEENEDSINILDQEDEHMSLEDHLDNLSNRLACDQISSQSESDFVEELKTDIDMEMNIKPEGYFNKRVKIMLQTVCLKECKDGSEGARKHRKFTRSLQTAVSITFPSCIKYSDLISQNPIFRKQKGKSIKCFDFFKLTKEF